MDLITLEEYKDFKGIKKPDDDSKNQMLISMVSALIQTYLGIPSQESDTGGVITETFLLDYDTNIIYLKHYPVESVISVTEPDRYTWDSTIHVPLVYGSEYILDAADGALIRQYTPGGFANWPIAPGVTTVSYIVAPKWEGGTTNVPFDLKLAAIKLVDYYKDEEYRQSKTISAGGSTSVVNTLAQGTDFPKHIQVVLDRYMER